ncbi:MAG: uroporphyrinogen-III C-methyltransferase [Flammeovirgaceae bacterium]
MIPYTHFSPRLTLVGAGVGDPELITLKGIKALQTADVVLYDALIHPDLLNYAQKAQKIYVGKRVGNYEYTQEEINELIVAYALEYGHVVRLKGGDPFVFGRGFEEMIYAEAFGIKVDIIPGVTSAIAAPALQRIPVTSRGLAESFWVLTGTTRTGELSNDLMLAAQSTATVVILMGTRKLGEIVEVYKNLGKSEMPIAIIQNASFPEEKVGIGTINSIERIAQEKQLGAPAVIVIGEVVNAEVLQEVKANKQVRKDIIKR